MQRAQKRTGDERRDFAKGLLRRGVQSSKGRRTSGKMVPVGWIAKQELRACGCMKVGDRTGDFTGAVQSSTGDVDGVCVSELRIRYRLFMWHDLGTLQKKG